MVRIVTLNANREQYDIREAAKYSMTVGELINELQTNYNENDKIVFSNDNGYTYGYVGAGYIDAQRVESFEEEDLRERLEAARDEIEELRDRYLESDDDEDEMTEDEYNTEREAILSSYNVTEEQYNKFIMAQ